MLSCDQRLTPLADDGFVLLPAVYTPDRGAAIAAALNEVFRAHAAAAPVRSDAGHVYAARNVLQLWPETARVAAQPPLPELLTALLGPNWGIVRALYFDKPPERAWALPWHKDLTVALHDNRSLGGGFTKPTVKAGVPHAEAPVEVLERMVTVRIHLDDVTEENGPLKVLPGSHRTGKQLQMGQQAPVTILANAGDVLLMRPLLAHASGHSHPETQRHRRILHLELAADAVLPGGCAWHEFHRVA